MQEQSLIGRPKITPIRMLLADDSDVIRRVLFVFLEDEPHIEIVGEAKDFTELLEKALALKPRIVLMDLHIATNTNSNLSSSDPNCKLPQNTF